jgi:Zn-dependent membrane protease YugP
MILAIPAALLVLALIVAPQLWIMSVMKRHGQQRPIIPWTGREFARHLLDGMKLTKVKVEETQEGDHYHPLAKAVRLKTDHYFGRSLTAIVIAAHEVGHAMQDATGYAPLTTRTRIVASTAPSSCSSTGASCRKTKWARPGTSCRPPPTPMWQRRLSISSICRACCGA